MGGLSNEPIPDSSAPQTEVLQTGNQRLSTSFGVVERPGYYCGDDLVNLPSVRSTISVEECEHQFESESCFMFSKFNKALNLATSTVSSDYRLSLNELLPLYHTH